MTKPRNLLANPRGIRVIPLIPKPSGVMLIRSILEPPCGGHQIFEASVAHRGVGGTQRRVHCVLLIWLVATVLIRALASATRVLRGIPTGITAINKCGDFIVVPRAMFSRERFSVARAEIDALNVSVPISVYALVETFGRIVVRVGITVHIDPQDFATQQRSILGTNSSVPIATSYPEVTSRTNAEPTAVVGARATKGLIGVERLILNVSYYIRPIRDALQVFADLEPHYDVAIALIEIGFAAGAVIFV